MLFCSSVPTVEAAVNGVFSQGPTSGLALKEIGPFLQYMESEFNVKVRSPPANQLHIQCSKNELASPCAVNIESFPLSGVV